MTLSAKIARIGENPTFIAAMAHCWFAFAAVVCLAHYLPAALVVVACLVLAAGKEFGFDLRYETTPKQTVMDSVIDFAGYSSGMLIAVGWLAVAKVVCR